MDAVDVRGLFGAALSDEKRRLKRDPLGRVLAAPSDPMRCPAGSSGAHCGDWVSWPLPLTESPRESLRVGGVLLSQSTSLKIRVRPDDKYQALVGRGQLIRIDSRRPARPAVRALPRIARVGMERGFGGVRSAALVSRQALLVVPHCRFRQVRRSKA